MKTKIFLKSIEKYVDYIGIGLFAFACIGLIASLLVSFYGKVAHPVLHTSFIGGMPPWVKISGSLIGIITFIMMFAGLSKEPVNHSDGEFPAGMVFGPAIVAGGIGGIFAIGIHFYQQVILMI